MTGNETILILEDDEALRAVVAETLQAAGYTVLEAESPQQAMRIATQSTSPIHLLIADVVLPVRSGPEMAVQIRNVQPNARVLLMSGYTDPLLDGNPLMVPGLPFIGKPFSRDVLLRKVREV